MAYATVEDIRARMTRPLTDSELSVCPVWLDDAGNMIDSWNNSASDDAKKIVSCNMVIRKLGSAGDSGIPAGATQGSMSGLGYAQSWTISGGSAGEMYLTKADKKLLGVGSRIGSYSPAQELSGGMA